MYYEEELVGVFSNSEEAQEYLEEVYLIPW